MSMLTYYMDSQINAHTQNNMMSVTHEKSISVQVFASHLFTEWPICDEITFQTLNENYQSMFDQSHRKRYSLYFIHRYAYVPIVCDNPFAAGQFNWTRICACINSKDWPWQHPAKCERCVNHRFPIGSTASTTNKAGQALSLALSLFLCMA